MSEAADPSARWAPPDRATPESAESSVPTSGWSVPAHGETRIRWVPPQGAGRSADAAAKGPGGWLEWQPTQPTFAERWLGPERIAAASVVVSVLLGVSYGYLAFLGAGLGCYAIWRSSRGNSGGRATAVVGIILGLALTAIWIILRVPLWLALPA